MSNTAWLQSKIQSKLALKAGFTLCGLHLIVTAGGELSGLGVQDAHFTEGKAEAEGEETLPPGHTASSWKGGLP